MRPVVRNVQNNDLYEWDGELYTNLRTGRSGRVEDEVAKKIFKFNVGASGIIHEFPLVKELIKRLNLKINE